MNKTISTLFLSIGFTLSLFAQEIDISAQIDQKKFDPGTLLWYKAPAQRWEEALPVGNGRLEAMAFGKYGEETIQLIEDTYWSGGPYSTVIKSWAGNRKTKLPFLKVWELPFRIMRLPLIFIIHL